MRRRGRGRSYECPPPPTLIRLAVEKCLNKRLKLPKLPALKDLSNPLYDGLGESLRTLGRERGAACYRPSKQPFQKILQRERELIKTRQAIVEVGIVLADNFGRGFKEGWEEAWQSHTKK